MKNIVHINFPEVTEIVREGIRKATGLQFLGSGEKGGNLCYVNSPELREEFRMVFREEDAGYYLYGLFHSSESLKSGRDLSGFRRDEFISPCSENMFWKLSQVGEELWRIHVNPDKTLPGFGYILQCDGDWRLAEVRFRLSGPDGGAGVSGHLGEIVLNDRCCISGVPESVWNFYIRGNYLAQVWLAERLGRTLSPAETSTYLHLLAALEKTALLVKEVDSILGDLRFSE